MHTSTITIKGQVTIPADIRTALKPNPGRRVAFRLEDGCVTLKLVRDNITAAFGLLESDRHNPVEELETAIGDTAVDRY